MAGLLAVDSPAFFPLLHNQIRSTLSVEGIPIAIEIHSAFSWFPTHSLITHADILFERSVALAPGFRHHHRLFHRDGQKEGFFFEEEESKSELPKLSFSGQSTLMRHSLAIIALSQRSFCKHYD